MAKRNSSRVLSTAAEASERLAEVRLAGAFISNALSPSWQLFKGRAIGSNTARRMVCEPWKIFDKPPAGIVIRQSPPRLPDYEMARAPSLKLQITRP